MSRFIFIISSLITLSISGTIIDIYVTPFYTTEATIVSKYPPIKIDKSTNKDAINNILCSNAQRVANELYKEERKKSVFIYFYKDDNKPFADIKIFNGNCTRLK